MGMREDEIEERLNKLGHAWYFGATDDKRYLIARVRELEARAREATERHADLSRELNDALPRPFGVSLIGAIAVLRKEQDDPCNATRDVEKKE